MTGISCIFAVVVGIAAVFGVVIYSLVAISAINDDREGNR